MARPRWFGVLAALVAAACGAAPQPTVTVNVDREPLGKTVEAIARQSGGAYEVEAQLRELPVSLHLERVTGDDAVRAAVSSAQANDPDIALERRSGAYRIYLPAGARPLPQRLPGPPPVARSIIVHFWDCPLREAVSLLQRAPASAPKIAIPPCKVEPTVVNRPIALLATHDSDAAIFRMIARQLRSFDPGTKLVDKEVGLVLAAGPMPAYDDPAVMQADLLSPPLPNPPVHRIVIGLRAVSLVQALQVLSNRIYPAFGKSLAISVADAVPDVKIKFDSVEIDPEASLRDMEITIRAQVPAVRFQRQGKLLKVKWQ